MIISGRREQKVDPISSEEIIIDWNFRVSASKR